MTAGSGQSTLELAAGWYIAAPSRAIGGRIPSKLDLFGRELVAWRDGAGRAAIMPRHCPHLGASLAEGKVVSGQLRCPFHHWRFDADGTCIAVTAFERPPSHIDNRRAYPVEERYGYVWAWYGGPEPLYPLPEVPALDTERRGFRAYRFSHTTPAPARRVLENAYDHYHFGFLHGVRATEPMRLTMLTDPAAAAENGPPIEREAWTGAILEADGLRLPRPLRAIGLRIENFRLLVDGWPSGQRLTFLLDGRVLAKELLSVTPVAAGHTIIRGWSLVRRTGNPLLDALTYLGYRGQHWWGTKEDLAIYRDASDAGGTVPVPYDHGVLRFRKHYADWVRRANADPAWAS